MPSENLNWFKVRDPRPDSLTNIRTAVDYLVTVGATHTSRPATLHAISKALNRHHKQVGKLIIGRPGFVEVRQEVRKKNSDGEFEVVEEVLGYYYDLEHFGLMYPASYDKLAGKPVLSVEVVGQSVLEAARETNKQLPILAKQIAKDAREAAKPDLKIWTDKTEDRTTLLVEFPQIEKLEALGLIATVSEEFAAGKLSDAGASELISALLSIANEGKKGK